MYTAITKSVVKASKEVLGQKKTAKKGWITSGTLKAIDLKNEIRAKLGDHSIQYKIHLTILLYIKNYLWALFRPFARMVKPLPDCGEN